ncbi:unnamed protein product [Chrysoparadoxa australica]
MESGPPRDVGLTNLYGCFEDSGHGSGPVCSVLELRNVTILLDCGWDINFDETLLDPLRDVVKKVDLVLISHLDLEHIGGLPYAVGKLGLSAPVFATLPTIKMGQMTLYDAFEMRSAEGSFDTITLEDIDKAFELFKPLKYSQHLKMGEGGRGSGITITPYASGRLIGGSIWRICWQNQDNDIVYAVAYNHQKEEHLNGGVLETFSRPGILITDVSNALTQQPDPTLPLTKLCLPYPKIMVAVRRGGNVLLPCDTAGRVLELMLILNAHWRRNHLGSYKLVLLHSMAFNTCEFAKSQLEWMSANIGLKFDLQRNNPFELRHVHIMHSLEELEELGNEPKVVFATDLSLDYGFSKALMLKWAPDPNNLILLTQGGHGNTTAQELLRELTKSSRHSSPLTLSVEVPMRVPLQGEELREHQEAEALIRRHEAEAEQCRRQEMEMEQRQVLADSDDEEQAAEPGQDKPGLKKRRIINASLFHRYSKPQHLMFGYSDGASVVDEYGLRESEPIGWLVAGMKQEQQMDLVARVEQAWKEEGAGRSEPMEEEEEEEDDETLMLGRQTSAFLQDQGVIPTKVELQTQEVSVLCQLVYIDIEGRCDGRSIKHLISTVGPRQLVLVGGGKEAVQEITAHFRGTGLCKEIKAPHPLEEVSMQLDADVHDVVLHDGLYSKLRWQHIKGYELAQVEAVARGQPEAEQGRPPQLCAPSETEKKGQATLMVSFGEVQLTALSTAFKRAGMTCSFGAAKVTVKGIDGNGDIVVTKGESGELQLDGPLSPQYFDVRKIGECWGS